MRISAFLIATVCFASAPLTQVDAKPGQDFPGRTCRCVGCASNGGDITGKCETVCKGKETRPGGHEGTSRQCGKRVVVDPTARSSTGRMSTPTTNPR